MEVATKNSTNPVVLLLASLFYSYFLVKKIPGGTLRVLSLIPVFYFFSVLPWYSSSSFLRGIIPFFITWIGSFKLLLFCFNKGPLITHKDFVDFVAITILPIKVKENAQVTGKYISDFVSATLLRITTRYEFVPLFNKPYAATSLQDFWGRRWNRLSSNILRQTIYEPTRNTLSGIFTVGVARLVALICTLIVSGIMHEVMFYYITCGKKPTWEVTWFFVFQGVCMVVEIALKKLVRVKGWTQVHPLVSNIFTVGFVSVTFYWLLVLPVWRSGQNECDFT